MTKNRPVGVTLLAILAVVGAIVAAYHTLQYLGIFSFAGPFGVFEFYGVNWFGSLMWALMVLIYIWVARMLWNLDPQGWIFVAALSTLNLILAALSIIGDTYWQEMLPALVVNGLILLYVLMPGTKDAFNSPSAE